MKFKLMFAGAGLFILASAALGSVAVRAADQGEGVPDGFGAALAKELGMDHAEIYKALNGAVAEKEAGGAGDVLGTAANELGIEREEFRGVARSALGDRKPN